MAGTVTTGNNPRTTPEQITNQAQSSNSGGNGVPAGAGVSTNPFAGLPDVANTDYYGSYANTIAATGTPGVFSSSVVAGTFSATPDAQAPGGSGWLYTYTGSNGQTATGFNLVNAISNFQNVFGAQAAAPGGTVASNTTTGETFVPGTFTAATTPPAAGNGSGGSNTQNNGVDPNLQALYDILGGGGSSGGTPSVGGSATVLPSSTGPSLPLQDASPVAGTSTATAAPAVSIWVYVIVIAIVAAGYLIWHHHLAVAQGKGEAEGQAEAAHEGAKGKGFGGWLHSLI